MRVAAYCRVSTEKEEQLESLENQKLFFEEFAQKHRYELVKIYADEGISGKQMSNRREFLNMLSDARLHLFDMVAVKDISRFSRNTVDFLNAVRQLKGLGIEVQFLSNNQTVLGNSEFILTIFSALAQEESANLSSRVKFGKRMSAQKGRVPNLIYGYDRVDTFTLAINEGEAQIVRRIFHRYVTEGQGSRKIALDLAAEGIPSKKGAGWTPKTVRRILQNPIYCGVLQNNKFETIDFLTGAQIRLAPERYFSHDRPELAIVSRELFEAAGRMLDERRGRYCVGDICRAGRHSSRHLLSTLIKCGDCGYSYSRICYTYKNTFIKWKCAGNNQYTSKFCPNNFVIDEAELLGQIQGYLDGFIRDRELFWKAVSEECERRSAQARDGADVQGLQRRIGKLERAKGRYKQLYADGLLSMAELREKLSGLDAQKAELTGELARAQSRAAQEPENAGPEGLAGLLSVSGWSNMQLREIIDRILVSRDGEVRVFFKRMENPPQDCL